MSSAIFHERVIAEIGSVHDGSFGNAMKAIDLAADCGADIVKFQTHIAEDETLPHAPSPPYFSGEPRFEYFKRTGFAPEQWRSLAEHAGTRGIGFLSSPFALSAVDLLESVGVGAYKIPSGEVTNTPLLERVAETGKPVFLSSGMSNWAELDRAIDVLRRGGPLAVMQCTSAYPCPAERVGLNVIDEMQRRWGLPVGFSDHTLGFAAGVAAAALGATVVEKHLTFSKVMYGSDASLAMEPGDFRRYAAAVKETWHMRRTPVDKADVAPFADFKSIFEKSIVIERDLPATHQLTRADLSFKKPGSGIPAWQYNNVLGRRLRRPVSAQTLLSPCDLED